MSRIKERALASVLRRLASVTDPGERRRLKAMKFALLYSAGLRKTHAASRRARRQKSAT